MLSHQSIFDVEREKTIRCLEQSICMKELKQPLKEWDLPTWMSFLPTDLTLRLLSKRHAELLINSLEIEKLSTGPHPNGALQESLEQSKSAKDSVSTSQLQINANTMLSIEKTWKSNIDLYLKTIDMELQSGPLLQEVSLPANIMTELLPMVPDTRKTNLQLITFGRDILERRKRKQKL